MYLIHFWLQTLVTYSFVVLMREVQGIDVQFVNSTKTSDKIGTGNTIFGIFYVCILNLVLCFLIGGALKKIPGLGKFL